jgi:hypothetical protein
MTSADCSLSFWVGGGGGLYKSVKILLQSFCGLHLRITNVDNKSQRLGIFVGFITSLLRAKFISSVSFFFVNLNIRVTQLSE